ncbi:MAG: ABC transporter permease [Candidatus Methanofastidiosia archaeon]
MSRYMAKYSAWGGRRTSRGQRLRFFIKEGLKRIFRSKWTILVLLLFYMLLVVPRVFAIVALPMKFEPDFYFSLFGEMEMFLILFAAVVGAGIIANDKKDNTIVLYFTRGISKSGYLIGKLTILFIAFSALTILPFIILFALALVSSNISLSAFKDNIWILGAGIALGVIVTLFLALLTAGLSTLLNDKRYAGAGLFVVVILSALLSDILISLNGNELMRLISLWDNLGMIGSYLFRMDSLYNFSAFYSFGVVASVIAVMGLAIYISLIRCEVRT